MGIDQGTTGTATLIFDDDWNVCSQGYAEHRQFYPKPGWVEHDPVEIWNKTKKSVATALDNADLQAHDLRAIGLANQGETCMAWDKKTGKPVYNAIVWQDRRTAAMADDLKEKSGKLISEKTGLPIDAYFSALKIKWILENIEDVRHKTHSGDLLVGTLDTWLLWKLTGGEAYITDTSTASRTMLFNFQTGRWDDEILELIGIPKAILPEINDSIMIHGYTLPAEFFDAKVPIAGSLVDQASALFGQACFHAGSIKTTYGTGCFMLMNTDDKVVQSQSGLITTVVWSRDKKFTFAIDAGVYITGAAIQWLRDGLEIIDSADETEVLARSVADTSGVYFVPAFVGLAAPHWDQYARGTIVGITGGTTRAHIVRATLEAIAYQVADNLAAMKADSGVILDTMRVDGGAVGNEFLMQFQADMLGIPVEVPVISETTALGAAMIGAWGVGDFASIEELSHIWKLRRRYEPAISDDQRQDLLTQWRRAVERARTWVKED